MVQIFELGNQPNDAKIGERKHRKIQKRGAKVIEDIKTPLYKYQ